MTSEEIAELCRLRVEEVTQNFEEGDDQGIALAVMDLSDEQVRAIADYVENCVHTHMFNHSIENGGGMNPTEFLDHVLGVAIPTLLLVARVIYVDNASADDQYMKTVGAEITLNRAIEEESDLSDIWPAAYVSEITKAFPEPSKAFLAGVICGGRNG